MNCPKCDSANVMPLGVGGKLWCKDCWYFYKPSDEPAAPPQSPASPRCPFCNSPDLKFADGKTSCRTCLREIEATEFAASPAPADPQIHSATSPPVLPVGLMNCPACAHRVSEQAASCPGCGHPFREPLSPYAASATVVIHALILCVVGWIISVVLLLIYDSMVASALRTGH